MRRLMLFGALAAASVAFGAPPATGHNAGCVLTGNGTWVFVGSGNEAPFVPEQNPNRTRSVVPATSGGSIFSRRPRATCTARGSPSPKTRRSSTR